MRRLFVIFGHQAIDSIFPSPILDWRSYIIDMEISVPSMEVLVFLSRAG